MGIKLSWKDVLWKMAFWLFGIFVLLIVGLKMLFYLVAGSWLVALPIAIYFLIIFTHHSILLIGVVIGYFGSLQVKAKTQKITEKIRDFLLPIGIFIFGLTLLWDYFLWGEVIWLIFASIMLAMFASMLFVAVRYHIRRIRIQRMIEGIKKECEDAEECGEPVFVPPATGIQKKD